MAKKILAWIQEQQPIMEELLQQWCLINTGTENITGLDQFRAEVYRQFSQLDCQIQEIEPTSVQDVTQDGQVRQVPVGKSLRISKIRPGKPRILLAGHMDTVFPLDSLFQELTPLPERCLQGPGVTDMKGGILVMLKALEAFEKSPLAEDLSWEVFLNADEETGSKGSMKGLLEAAEVADIGLCYEPCMPHGALAGQRKGSANYSILAKGKAAHAGREFNKGRNAITGLNQILASLDELNQTRDSITLNIAQVHGGGALNVVPDTAVGRFNIRVATPNDQVWFESLIQALLTKANQQEGLQFELFGGFTRPPKPVDYKTQLLCEIIRKCGASLGIDIQFEATGGCCDGNNLAAAGVTTIDTLGVRGAHIHSSDEFIWLDSLSERAQLSFLILSELAKNHKELRRTHN